LVIGVGDEVDDEQLERIAGRDGKWEHVKDFDVLRSAAFVRKISKEACEREPPRPPPPPPPSSNKSGCCDNCQRMIYSNVIWNSLEHITKMNVHISQINLALQNGYQYHGTGSNMRDATEVKGRTTLAECVGFCLQKKARSGEEWNGMTYEESTYRCVCGKNARGNTNYNSRHLQFRYSRELQCSTSPVSAPDPVPPAVARRRYAYYV